MGLVGKKAPIFSSGAVINGSEIVESFSLEQFKGKKVVLFFYPLDFTFVCPTELLAFQDKLAEFEKRNTVVVGCSVDSEHTHWAWLNTAKNDGGIKGVKYPLIADLSKSIAMNFGVLAGDYDWDDEGNQIFVGEAPIAYRGTFLIDEDGMVQHESINALGLGRNVDETLRLVDALTHLQEHGEVCPAGWNKGDEAMNPSHDGVSDYLSKH